jgi:hypothetical protein
VTEWDREFLDLGDIVPDSDMSDASVTKIHRGAEDFDSGQSEIAIVGSADCEIRLDYRVGTMR